MRVKNIHIKNYKGFEDCAIDFHPSMNVFIGSNASGKTTLLNAILLSVKSVTDKLIRPENVSRPRISFRNVIPNDDLNYKAVDGFITTEIYDFLGYEDSFYGNSTKNLIEESAVQIKNNKFAGWITGKLNSSMTIPIFKYYSAKRNLTVAYNESNVSNSGIYMIPQLETWDNINGIASFNKFHKWFIENETNELLMQRDARDFDKQNPALADVRKALGLAFKLLGYESVSLKTKQIKRAGSARMIPILVLENAMNKEEEILNNKSDGEKTIITLIADIAYNLSIAKDFVSDDHFLNSPGVVMIDEIETHLHPNWQRKIIPMLTEIFPNIQFFIATHSPQILSSVKSESVFFLSNFNSSPIHFKTLGEDSNSLLRNVFDSTDRPEQFIELIEKFDQLMTNEAEEKELQNVIDEIKQLYNKDDSTAISNLIDDLNIQLSAYLFDKNYEED